MAHISVNNLTVKLTDPPLLENVSLQLEEDERVCLLGRNGTGKSTLMMMLAGAMAPDADVISRKPGLRVAYLPQEVPQNLTGRVFDIINSGHSENESQFASDDSEEEWKQHQQTERMVSMLNLDANAEVSLLSAGWKRRVLLAKGLVCNPHVLLLDEPTNHLDIASIDWLEKFLLRFDRTLLFVTHDRMFLRKLATRIIEIDRGSLFNWSCNYEAYLQRKENILETEEMQRGKFDKKLAQEEEWLSRSPKARRTRNEGRVRTLLKMREERRERRNDPGSVRLLIQQAERSGKLVIDAENVSFSYGDHPIVQDFSVTIVRGDKVGLIGPNGAGKTTLLKILLKELEVQTGTIRHGTNLEIAYFDQLREQLNEEETVVDNVGGGADRIVIDGKPRHIYGYLSDFLFDSERARSPVKILSGGERNRVLLAKLFTNPANVLVLDEPTNDLDAETLELLENLLVEYSGTVLLVSHDREFLNNVVTTTLALEGDGDVNEYVGGYDDWMRQRRQTQVETKEKRIQERKEQKTRTAQPNRLSYNQKRSLQTQHKELQQLPREIERLETEQAELHRQMADPAFFKQDRQQITQAQDRLTQVDRNIRKVYERWEALEVIFEEVDMNQVF